MKSTTKGFVFATVVLIVVGGYYGYDIHSTRYLSTVNSLRKNGEINVIKVSWDDYKTVLDRFGKMWPVDLQYVGWDEFVEFEAGKPQGYKRYFDPDSQRIWVENIFVGTSMRVVVYEHITLESFVDTLTTWIKNQ